MALLSQEEAKRVVEAVKDVEGRSATEVVVAVLPASDGYHLWRGLFAGAVAIGLAEALHVAFPGLDASWWFALQLPLAAAVFLSTRGSMLRFLVPRSVFRGSTEQRAFRLFAERGVHNTRDQTGLLILLSEVEHQAVILGDRGIDAEIGPEGWQRYVDTLANGVKKRAAAAAVVEVLQEVGGLLEAKFPRRADDQNEIPDDIVTS